MKIEGKEESRFLFWERVESQSYLEGLEKLGFTMEYSLSGESIKS